MTTRCYCLLLKMALFAFGISQTQKERQYKWIKHFHIQKKFLLAEMSLRYGIFSLFPYEFQSNYHFILTVGNYDTQEKILMIRDQQKRLHELEAEHAYNTQKMESGYQDKIHVLMEQYRTGVEELKVKNEVT